MRANLERLHGLVCSEHVMLKLVDRGLPKDEAYRCVQAVAMDACQGDGDFRAMIAAAPEVKAHLSVDDLAACFDYDAHVRVIQTAYDRLGI